MDNFWMVVCTANRSDINGDIPILDTFGFVHEKDALRRTEERKQELESSSWEIKKIKPYAFVKYEPNSYTPCEEN